MLNGRIPIWCRLRCIEGSRSKFVQYIWICAQNVMSIEHMVWRIWLVRILMWTCIVHLICNWDFIVWGTMREKDNTSTFTFIFYFVTRMPSLPHGHTDHIQWCRSLRMWVYCWGELGLSNCWLFSKLPEKQVDILCLPVPLLQYIILYNCVHWTWPRCTW